MDSDFVSNLVDKKSTTGCLFQLASGAMSWRSKTQTIVSLSTGESEYVAMSTIAREFIQLNNLAGILAPRRVECFGSVGMIRRL